MDTWWRNPKELDSDQRAVIALPPDGSFLVKGPPGSGKTNLLLLRANYLTINEHPNLTVVVFNRTLREFIRAGAENYNFSPDRIVTLRQMLDTLLSEANVEHDVKEDFHADRVSRLAAVNDVFEMGREPIYDVILLDESQDYLADELRLFKRLSHHIFLVADSRQQIYAGGSKPDLMEDLVDKVLSLRYHYRNGQPICDVADAIGATFSMGYDPIGPTCNYNSPKLKPSVEVEQRDLDAQIGIIAERLKVQLRTYPGELLGVICPRNVDLKKIAVGLEAKGLGPDLCVQQRDEGYQPIEPTKSIWVSSVHSAKGLEFRAVHFACAEYVSQFGPEQKRLAYTGVTRAKTSLSIFHDGVLPAYFDSAVNRFRISTPGHVEIGAAFGPKR